MNRKQKICLWIGIIVIVVLGIYPHWMIIVENPVRGESAFISMGRHFLLHQYHKQWQIDMSRLSVQWIIVAVITGGLFVTFADKKDKKPKEEQKE